MNNKMLTLLRRVTLSAAILFSGSAAFAGSYSQNFTSGTLNSQTIGGGDTSTLSSSAGTITTKIVNWIPTNNKALQLMGPTGGSTASWKMPDLDPGKEIQSFDANFVFAIHRVNTNAIPGAGWSLNFGAIPTGNGVGDGGFVMANGIVIAYDIFNNGGSDNPSIEIFCNGTSVGNFPAAALTDSPIADSGTFTLTNPVTGETTAPIAFNATGAQVQAAMRLVAGWNLVGVTGSAGGIWTVDHGVVDAYADPIADTTGLVPANSVMYVNALTPPGDSTHNQRWTLLQRAFRARTMSMHWDYNGLDVVMNGTAVCTDVTTAGFIPSAGNKFAFSARTEGSNTMEMILDDVVLSTTQLGNIETGGPVISEFMADNSNTLEDEDTDSPDWIEIFNGQNATANLSGYRLTNVAGNHTLWTIPTLVPPITMAPYTYKIIYASGKNRTAGTGQLHTNFTLQKESGYLALIKPDGVTKASEYTYGPQFQDISYGEKGPGRTLGYLNPPTPGAKTTLATDQAASGLAEEVVWSREGGLIKNAPATVVTITAPVAANSVVRYTTANTEPNASSAIYNPASPPAVFTVSSTTTLRARVFTPGKLAGPVSSRTFLLIDSSLTNYNASGQPFSSHLPIIVLDSFGVPVDNYIDINAGRPYRLSYGVVIDKDPITGRANIDSQVVDFRGRCGTHVRGSSSAGFPQRQYAWELWDNSNNDKKSSILGMPEESDWVIYAPYNDKALMRNFFIYSRARLANSNPSFGVRTKYCEVFFNQTAGEPVSYNDYRGVFAIVEKIKRGTDRVDVAKLNTLTTDPTLITGGYVLKHDRTGPGDSFFNTAGGVEVGSVEPPTWNAAQQTYLSTYFNNFESALNGGNFADPVNGYQKYIDRDTFIDNQWFVEIAKQIDGYRLSQYFWKERGGKVKNGPIWDYNLSMGNANYLFGDIATGWYYTQLAGADYAWYPRLHQDTTGASPYEQRHWDRYWELRRGIFTTSAVTAEIDAEAMTLLNNDNTPISNNMATQPPAQENAVRRHYREWPVLGVYLWPNAGGDPVGAATITPRPWQVNTTFQSEIDWMKNWLVTRLAWIDNQYFFGTAIFRPPNFSSYGGNVNAGSTVTMTAYTGAAPNGYTYATGNIYYTTDGSDPRGANNTPNATATLYSSAVALNASETVKARLYNAGAAKWSPATTANFIVEAAPATAANLVVSEIMYDPPVASAAEISAGYSTNDFEYIELLNVGATSVDLSNVAFTVGITFNFGSNNPALLTVSPGGRMVVAGNMNAFLLRYGNNPAVKLTGPFGGSFANEGEPVKLLAANQAIIADFTYGNVEPWPVDAHGGTGYSLVLNNPAPNLTSAYYNDGANWRSSGTYNGTPGQSNGTTFLGLPSGDTDGDGLSDYFEYATGSNMGSTASRNLPVAGVAAYTVGGVTSNYLRFQYRRNLSADGVHYTVQSSADLTTWSSDPSAVVYVSTQNNGDGTATVTYRAAAPMSPAVPKLFLRLSVAP